MEKSSHSAAKKVSSAVPTVTPPTSKPVNTQTKNKPYDVVAQPTTINAANASPMDRSKFKFWDLDSVDDFRQTGYNLEEYNVHSDKYGKAKKSVQSFINKKMDEGYLPHKIPTAGTTHKRKLGDIVFMKEGQGFYLTDILGSIVNEKGEQSRLGYYTKGEHKESDRPPSTTVPSKYATNNDEVKATERDGIKMKKPYTSAGGQHLPLPFFMKDSTRFKNKAEQQAFSNSLLEQYNKRKAEQSKSKK